MSKYVITDTTLSNIADAIRAKTGKADMITPEQMPTEIAGITTGGGSSADVRYVTFMNGDTVLYKKPVAVGDDCVDVLTKGLIETPTKESTAQYNYTYYGWGASDGGAADANILKNITEDKTVYAVFTATVRYYTITWLDSDGVTELPGQKQWAYGTVPSYTPEKEDHIFVGWTPEPVAVTADASYSAVWELDTSIASGTLSSGVTWTLKGTGAMVIAGSGAMDDYAYQQVRPWDDYVENITSVIIQKGVTHIGDRAFYLCNAITNLTIPSGVITIGTAAFWGCSIASIDLPEGLQTIGPSAFRENNFTNVTFPNSLKTISGGAFGNCAALESVTIDSGVTLIENYAFSNCNALTYAKFIKTATWKVYNAGTEALVATLNVTKLKDTSQAATWLKETYSNCIWKCT